MLVHPTAQLGRPRLVTRPEAITIGAHTYIRDDWRLEAVPHPGGAGSIRIGDYCGIEFGFLCSAAQPLVIGNEVLISGNVTLLDHNHAYENPDLAVIHQGIKLLPPVTIGRGAWIGQNAVVLASVGEHSVVGANAVVTEPVPDYCVAVGQPARVVKRFNKWKRRWEAVQ